MLFLGLVSTVLILKTLKLRIVIVSLFFLHATLPVFCQITVFLHPAATKGSSVSDLPGFGSFELKAKLLRQNSIVKDQATLSMLQSDELERTPSNPRYLVCSLLRIVNVRLALRFAQVAEIACFSFIDYIILFY